MSAMLPIDQFYEQQIRVLSRTDRLRLLARIADDLDDADALQRSLSALDLLAQSPGGRAFTTATEVSVNLAQERGTWKP